jgi:hypothetical protein
MRYSGPLTASVLPHTKEKEMLVNQCEIATVLAVASSLNKVWNDMHDTTVRAGMEQSDLFRIIKDLVWNAKQLARGASDTSSVIVGEPH